MSDEYYYYFVDMKKLLLLCSILCLYANAMGQWGVLPTPTSKAINQIFMASKTIGYAVGDTGLILKTINSGLTWAVTTSGAENLKGVYFKDKDNGWIVGSNSTFLSTIDGGTNWTPTGLPVAGNMNAISFYDSDTGLILGENGIILKTINGGSSFSALTTVTVYFLSDVAFVSGMTFVVVGGGGTILRTIDGGDSLSTRISGTSQILSGIDFVTDSLAYISGGNGTVLRSQDQGINWQTFATDTTEWFQDIYCDGVDKCYITGTGGILMHSVNDSVWTYENSATTSSLQSFFFLDKYSGYAAGKNGVIIRNCPVAKIAVDSLPIIVNKETVFLDSSKNSDTIIWLFSIPGDFDTFYTANVPYTFDKIETVQVAQVVINSSGCSDTVKYLAAVLSGIKENSSVLESFSVEPNPFLGNTTLRYKLLTGQRVRITVFDLMGRELEVVYSGNQSSGRHQYQVSAPAGVSILQLIVGDSVQELKLIGF